MNTQEKTITQIESPYFRVTSKEGVESFPLQSTSISAKVVGPIAYVTVKQVYQNRGTTPIEATYCFPGSTRAAVHGMTVTIGERKLIAQIEEKQKARKMYEEARDQGYNAALLEQHRPNVFEMNVANIMPNDHVETEIQYSELLDQEACSYSFYYPAVVGAKFVKQDDNQSESIHAFEQSSNNVSSIHATQPYEHQGVSVEGSTDFAIDITNPIGFRTVTCISGHVLQDTSLSQTQRIYQYHQDTILSKSISLRWELDTHNTVQSGVILHNSQDTEKYFVTSIVPKPTVALDKVLPREYIFILDESGSMSGFPYSVSRSVLEKLSKTLRPLDMINLVLFSDDTKVWKESGSINATQPNISSMLQFVPKSASGGGTYMLNGLKRAFSISQQPDKTRIVIILTDGELTGENEIFKYVRENRNNATVFGVCIGSSGHTYLTEGLAAVGGGEALTVMDHTDQGMAEVDRLLSYLSHPVMTDIVISTEGDPTFELYEYEPVHIDSLFEGRPITIFGKYRGDPKNVVFTISGKIDSTNEVVVIREVPLLGDYPVLKQLWARKKVQILSDYTDSSDEIVKQVTELGLQYSIVTKYTSFVAVDTVKRHDGTYEKVKQPLPLPDGVEDSAVGELESYRGTTYPCNGRVTSYSKGGNVSTMNILGGFGNLGMFTDTCSNPSATGYDANVPPIDQAGTGITNHWIGNASSGKIFQDIVSQLKVQIQPQSGGIVLSEVSVTSLSLVQKAKEFFEAWFVSLDADIVQKIQENTVVTFTVNSQGRIENIVCVNGYIPQELVNQLILLTIVEFIGEVVLLTFTRK